MIIIPARLKSTRFENKILCEINSVPMFIATAKKAALVDEVIIAVDDEKVLEIATKHGFKAVLTSPLHESGTDRINEACVKLGLSESEIIINLQADEPFIERENLLKFKDFASKFVGEKTSENAFMVSCFKQISKEEAKDANLVKVVLDSQNYALYFSRAKIPYERADFEKPFLGHLGIYAYSVKDLNEFCKMPPSSLEKAEKLEQLRALENTKKIKMLEISTKSIGIDTKEDYERAIKIWCCK